VRARGHLRGLRHAAVEGWRCGCGAHLFHVPRGDRRKARAVAAWRLHFIPPVIMRLQARPVIVVYVVVVVVRVAYVAGTFGTFFSHSCCCLTRSLRASQVGQMLWWRR
jgi:hypothetical protein